MEGKTILMVDDDVEFSEMISEILQDEGARLIVEHDGLTGFNQATQSHPDLIMMDLMMPRMSGVEALQKIRASDWGKTVPVMLLTNMSQAEVPREDGEPTEVLLKTDLSLGDIVEHAKKLLGAA
jgi:two-component system alkaline phosphatase synthesis response regulator PhoP